MIEKLHHSTALMELIRFQVIALTFQSLISFEFPSFPLTVTAFNTVDLPWSQKPGTIFFLGKYNNKERHKIRKQSLSSFLIDSQHQRPFRMTDSSSSSLPFLQDESAMNDPSDETSGSASGNGKGPKWCEEQQIYIDGTIASSSHAEDHINSILSSIKKHSSNTHSSISSSSQPNPQTQLHIFGYGSLCWNPGSKDEVLANERVTKNVANAIGWKRCWCQKSTDHRGHVSFPGLVCTLLSDDEIFEIKQNQRKQQRQQQQNINTEMKEGFQHLQNDKNKSVSMTEGVLYTIPSDLVEQCLAELDFREKGGYARDIIDVMVKNSDGSQVKYQKALLYRGTPDNPAFSKRALLDPSYASSIMAVAKGPSGSNDAYLFNLDKFLSSTTISTDTSIIDTNTDDMTVPSIPTKKDNTQIGDLQTKYLASLTHSLQKDNDLYFLLGAGSNQHNQLLLSHTERDFYGDYVNAVDLINGEDAHVLNDIFLVTPKSSEITSPSSSSIVIKPKILYAGGGHSALLSEHNDLYLWGWNEYGQLGRTNTESTSIIDKSHVSNPVILPSVIEPLKNIKVQKAALGQSHTLVIEELTGKLYCFGDDSRGQVSGLTNTTPIREDDTVFSIISPSFAMNDKYVDIAAGVFHSAAITVDGELVTFGCGKFNQSLPKDSTSNSVVGRWKPDDGSKLIQVACGRRHTVVLDEHGRVWTMGENKKYGQLGRKRSDCKKSPIPELVDGLLGRKGSGCIHIDCGWSHTIATICTKNNIDDEHKVEYSMFGWGRSDKSQFGIKDNAHKDIPKFILNNLNGKSIQHQMVCGSESVMVLDADGDIYGCGWNEHGNLATGSNQDKSDFTKITGAKIRNFATALQIELKEKQIRRQYKKIVMAAGGAHFLVTVV